MDKYIAAEFEIIKFEAEDVLTASCPGDQGCPADE